MKKGIDEAIKSKIDEANKKMDKKEKKKKKKS